MKRLSMALCLCTVAASVLAGPPASRYIVMTQPSAREAQIRGLQTDGARGERHVREFRHIDAFAATLTAEEVAQLRRSPLVRFVSPVVERHLLDSPSAPFRPASETSVYQTKQTVPYGLDLIHARDVWVASRGDKVTVNAAILDTGIDYHHPELVSNYLGGYNALAQTDDPFDDNKHGTHVAGTIGAADNGIGVVGVAPVMRIWAVKVLDENGNGSDEALIAGLDWVLAKKQATGGNWIVSLSLGSNSTSAPEEETFRRVAEAGVLVVAAAGNSGLDGVDYPAKYPGVFAIGAVDDEALLARFSNHGPRLDVVAPGVSVLSTVPVGTANIADVTFGDSVLDAVPLEGSPKGDVSAPYVLCGIGKPEDFPSSVKDGIAVIRRGMLTFNEKVKNAKAAGARGVVILARSSDIDDRYSWTLIRGCNVTCDDQTVDKAFDWPVTVSLMYADGETMLRNTGPIVESYRGDDYSVLSGTSMATPHVSGVAALLWSLAPSATAENLIRVIEMTARDLGKTGYDPQYGYGLVDAIAAAKQIAPNAFGIPTPPPTPPVSRRRSSSH